MRKRSFARAAACGAAVLVGLLLLAGCGSSSSSGDAGSAATATNASQKSEGGEPTHVALIADVAGINDHGFGQLAAEGLKRAEGELGVEGKIFTSASAADYLPNLAAAAREGNDLVVAMGFNMAESVGTAAAQFPETNFAIIDISQGEIPGTPSNVVGLVYKQEEAGFLVGYAAGMWAKQNGAKAVSAVGGEELPPVVKYIAGYEAGAKLAAPEVELISGFSQTFGDQAKCKEVALEQIARGSQVVFAVAGNCGLGAVDAAGEEGVEAIGVDADQAYLGPQVLTSALKKVDVSVYDIIKQTQEGSTGGTDLVFDLRNNGVGVGKFAPGNSAIAKQVTALEKKIIAGEGPQIPSS